VSIDNRPNLRGRYVSDWSAVQTSEWNPVGMTPGRPNEGSIELQVTLYQYKVRLNLRLDSPAGPLPSMLLRYSASESMHRDRPFVIDYMADQSTQCRSILLIEETIRIGCDILRLYVNIPEEVS